MTWEHNKDHRPDRKQLLYNLTVTAESGVPVAFGIEHGNVTDDQTHRAMWDLLCKIVESPDFIYVADSKLVTHANMTHIANRGISNLFVTPFAGALWACLPQHAVKKGLPANPSPPGSAVFRLTERRAGHGVDRAAADTPAG